GRVREYWLIDPQRKRAEFHRFGKDGTYIPMPIDSDGKFHSEILQGFWMKVDWLWHDPMPTDFYVLKQWGLI
ncbi:Uma2 family endonuclease, partial [Candidatus Sumerlaeota bacterium]|nr:Uma2 family endonuclease [Candidatus Sumerlaeota bacterium]